MSSSVALTHGYPAEVTAKFAPFTYGDAVLLKCLETMRYSFSGLAFFLTGSVFMVVGMLCWFIFDEAAWMWMVGIGAAIAGVALGVLLYKGVWGRRID